MLAVILAACVLAVLLIPGVLVFPRNTVAYTIDLGQAEASLRQRITDLQAAIDNGTCGASGGTTGGSSPGGSAPPRAPALVTPAPAIPAPDESKAAPTAIAPEPRQVALSTADGGEATTLVDTLDSAAVLVVGYFGNSVATGSGFFINETDIVTNRHVVEEADTDKLVVVNKALGRPVPVSIVAMTPNSDITSPDFALLRLAAHDKTHGVLTLASAAQRAQNVLAYGYPAFVMESDTQYRCLLEGGEGCIPLGSTSQGFVTALQDGNGGLGLIVHSAALSGGNSGGPLVDYCGRVIGVNTFVKKTSAGAESLNFAQRAPALAAFLKSVHTEVPLDDGGCRLIPKPPADTAAAVPGN